VVVRYAPDCHSVIQEGFHLIMADGSEARGCPIGAWLAGYVPSRTADATRRTRSESAITSISTTWSSMTVKAITI
jgi:hypothetical protein